MFLLCFLPTLAAQSQWVKVFQTPPIIVGGAPYSFEVRASFFFNEKRGIIGADGKTGIFRTYDGGTTWQQSLIPPGYTFNHLISDIFMKDSLNGWATIIGGAAFSHNLWRTTDGGVKWFEVQAIVETGSSVYETSKALLLTQRDRVSANGFFISADGANSFFPISNSLYDGLNFVDDLHGVASTFTGSTLYTADGGLTWGATSQRTESWEVYADKGTPNFVMAGEKNQTSPIPFTDVVRSQDYGINWQQVGQLPIRTTGHIEGVGNTLYVQSSSSEPNNNKPQQGIFRSTDGGYSWKFINGPINYRDTRFSVVGCMGQTVYAFDLDGGVWKTMNGGDGLITGVVKSPILDPNTIGMTADACNSTFDSVRFTNLSCEPINVDRIFFADSSLEIVSSGALSFTSLPPFPLRINPSYGAKFKIKWNPSASKQSVPGGAATIVISSTTTDGLTQLDTFVSIGTNSLTTQPSILMSVPDYVAMKNVNICSHQDTIITVTNPFCDSLSVLKASLNTSGWELLEADGSNTALKLPISLGAGSKKKILIRFTPGSIGLSDTKLSLTLFHDVFFKDTTLIISCGSYRNTTVIGLDSIDVGAVSICSLRDTNIIIRNLGCETLRVDSLILTGSSEFSIGGGFVMPRQLFPDSTIVVPIRFLPRKWVESIARIVLYFNATGDSLVFPLSLHGEGVYGNSTFTASTNTPLFTFPARTICDKADSITFRFHNTGCDTTVILKVDFATTSPSIFTPSYSQLFPYVLDPSGNTFVMKMQASPRSIGHHTASYHLRYQMSDNTIIDTTYSFEFDVTRGTRIMKYSLSTIDLGNNALCDARDTVIEMQNIGCDSVKVKSISLQESHYSIVKSTEAPFTLLAGARDSVWLRYSPTTVGSYKTDLRFETNTDVDSSVGVPIYAATLDKNYIRFRLQSPDLYLVAGDTLRMNVIPDLDWAQKEMTALEFDLIYNGDLFTFINTFHKNPFRVDTSMISQEKRKSILHVKLSSNTDIPLSKDSALLFFTFLARLSDTLESTFQLKNIRLNNGDGFYDKCILSSSAQDTTATLSLLCGESILYRFLRKEPLLQAGTITPNPVTRESNYTFTIPFKHNASGEVHVELVGTSGEVYLSHEKRIQQSGKDAFIIDLSKLPAGNYEYILRLNDMRSLPIRGRVVLLK